MNKTPCVYCNGIISISSVFDKSRWWNLKTIQRTELLMKRYIATKYSTSSPRFTTLGENVTDFSNFSGIPHPESKLTKY